MIGYRDLEKGFKELGLIPQRPVIIHVALDSFDFIRGGIETLLGAVTANTYSIITPAFTYRTMVIPEDGSSNNGITYGTGRQANVMVEAFHMDMPADDTLGVFPKIFSRMPGVARSTHPILSFYGIHAEEYLGVQSILEPLTIIEALLDRDGLVVLVNVDHTANTSIHLGERLANRRTFTRWALIHERVVACPNFPGCSSGFGTVTKSVEQFSGTLDLSGLEIKAIPLRDLVATTRDMILADPNALLCQRPDCERCNSLRQAR
ncbi:MAG: AAC(3) family N-acetyltransferase [Anaerolineaceae bacterium]